MLLNRHWRRAVPSSAATDHSHALLNIVVHIYDLPLELSHLIFVHLGHVFHIGDPPDPQPGLDIYRSALVCSA